MSPLIGRRVVVPREGEGVLVHIAVEDGWWRGIDTPARRSYAYVLRADGRIDRTHLDELRVVPDDPA